MQGLHLTADLYGCAGDSGLLERAPRLALACRQRVCEAGLTPVAERFHRFAGAGVTGMVLLAESHLAVHTWPELDAATLDVYVCNVSRDNSSRAQCLLDGLISAFAPRHQSLKRIERGAIAGAATPPRDQGPIDARPARQAAAGRPAPILEALGEDGVYGFRPRHLIESRQSAHQRIDVFDTGTLGRVLRIDDRYMTSTGDEFFYHEAMIHPAAIAHPAPRRALIIGGGDGGAAEELLKHPSIERIDLVELDAEVIATARRHLQAIHRGAFDDARVQIHIDDGAAFVARDTGRYDLVILDLTDPDTVASHLYDEAFFERLASRLDAGGLVSLHLGAPVHGLDQVVELTRRLRSRFAIVRPMGTHVPLYGSYWAFAVASQDRDPLAITRATVAERLQARGIRGLRLYHSAFHASLFTLPAYLHDRLDPQAIDGGEIGRGATP